MDTSTSTTMVNRRTLLMRAFIFVALIGSASSAFAQDAWDHTNSSRFQLLAPFANNAVLDRETGIVWERAPSPQAFTWDAAQRRCNTLVVGNRLGWRVPTLQELTSILSAGSPNNLEAGHPFAVLPPWNVGEIIWSATTAAANTNNAWAMNLSGNIFPSPKNSLSRCWCVRFRQGVDPQ